MDTKELYSLYSQIREIESKLWSKFCDLRSDTSERVSRIWMVMFLGFYVLSLFGMLIVHNWIHDSYTAALSEMRREMAAIQARAPPQALPLKSLKPHTVK